MMEQDMSIVVFNMLPTSVQSRLPALQSLRRSTSFSILSSGRRSTPPQKDIEQLVIARRDDGSVVELQACATAADVANSRLEEDRPKTSSSDGSISNTDSGVKWRYAAQGTFLQHSASQETADLVFARKSYIDGVAYMLRALPDDMDDYETSVIRQALPMSCAPIGVDGQIEAGPGRPGWQPSERAKTFLHATVQGFVTGIVLFVYLLLSFLASVIRTGAYYERQYNVSQHLVSRGFVFATALGKQSGVLGEKICAMGEGRLGKALSVLAGWTVESVTGGIQDGIGQGLLLIEQRRK
ncbi:hypothetical protein F4677DRAFT_408478 [Hypoxylon crocopeplum]|nr:hypothetical protein F4677DRAFT_408478 [Hypoxylon crocopeplum]